MGNDSTYQHCLTFDVSNESSYYMPKNIDMCDNNTNMHFTIYCQKQWAYYVVWTNIY